MTVISAPDNAAGSVAIKGSRPGRRLLLGFLALWLLLAVPLISAPRLSLSHGHRDIPKIASEALDAGKDKLVIFTGLEWESWSRKLRDETLDNAVFQEALAKDFVLTSIDLPKIPNDSGNLSALERRHYELAQNLRLHAIPSIYLCDSDGRPYALLGYLAGGPESVLEAIRTRKAAYMRLNEDIHTLQGPPLAVAIDTWLKTLPEIVRSLHQEKMELILKADMANETGLRPKYKRALLMPKAREDRYVGKIDEAEALYLDILKEAKPSGEELQTIYYEMGDVYLQKHDYNRLLDVVDQAINAAPNSWRMPVLNEMIDVFTHRWIYTKYKPKEMKKADYDYKKITIQPEEINPLRKLIREAKTAAPQSLRNEILDRMLDELGRQAEPEIPALNVDGFLDRKKRERRPRPSGATPHSSRLRLRSPTPPVGGKLKRGTPSSP